jgi:anti-anti-sigma factor
MVHATAMEEAIIVRLAGRSSGSADEVASCRSALLHVYSAAPRLVIVDLSDLLDINSALLGALLLCRRLSLAANGTLRLAGARPAVRQVLANTRLLMLFDCMPDVQAALAAVD